MNITGPPTWTWPEWRKAPSGTRFRHNQSGRLGTFVKPSKNKHNGAIVRWDGLDKDSNVVAPARDLTPVRYKAWDLIGFDGTTEVIDRLLGGDPNYAEPGYTPNPARVRVRGGRTLYESVGNDGGETVRLSRLMTDGSLHAVIRYIDPDTELEIVHDV